MTNVTILFIAVVIIIVAVIIIVGEIKELKRETNRQIKVLTDEREELEKEAWYDLRSRHTLLRWRGCGAAGDIQYEGNNIYNISEGPKEIKLNREEVKTLINYINTFQNESLQFKPEHV